MSLGHENRGKRKKNFSSSSSLLSRINCIIDQKGKSKYWQVLKKNFLLSFFFFTLTGCREGTTLYRLGEQMSSNRSCHNCYCSYGGIKKCKKIQCSPDMPGCIPVTPEGHCCPVEYKCNNGNNNNNKGEYNSITYCYLILHFLKKMSQRHIERKVI